MDRSPDLQYHLGLAPSHPDPPGFHSHHFLGSLPDLPAPNLLAVHFRFHLDHRLTDHQTQGLLSLVGLV